MNKHGLENAQNWYYKSVRDLQMTGGALFSSNIYIIITIIYNKVIGVHS